MSGAFTTPVAIFTFNRPLLTERLMGVLVQVKPRRILVIADGPRAHVTGEAEQCAAVRRLFENPGWECEVETNYADTNMGSFARNSSGINWVFDQVEEAILLEDDCVPDVSFFAYCEEMLERYRNCPGVGLITGNNFLVRKRGKNSHSYFFSGYATTWGWASWRRTWKQVDFNMSYWPEFRDSGELRRSVYSVQEERYWRSIYDAIHNRTMKNAWDYQLILTCLRLGLLTVVPSVNLVSNIGFGADGTHCIDEDSPLHNVPTSEMKYPLRHPAEVSRSKKTDYAIFKARFAPAPGSIVSMIMRALLSRSKLARNIKRVGKYLPQGKKAGRKP